MMLKPISFLRKASGGGGGAVTSTFVDGVSALTTDSATHTLDLSSVSSGDELVMLCVKASGAQTTGMTALDLESVAMTLDGSTSTTASRAKAYVFRGLCPAAAAGNATADFDGTMSGGNHWGVFVWKLSGTPTTETIASNQYTNNTDPLIGDVSGVDGGTIMSVGIQEGGSGSFSWNVGTERADFHYASTNDIVSCIDYAVTATGNVDIEGTHGSTGHSAIISLAVS